MTDEDRIAETLRLLDAYVAAFARAFRSGLIADARTSNAARAALEAHLRAALAPAAVLCGCGDQIVPDDAAKCGVCAMQDAEDAARYRLWRTLYTMHDTEVKMPDLLIALADAWTPADVDAAIDAARAPQEGSQP